MKSYTSVIALNGSVLLFMCGVGMIVAALPQRILNVSGSVSEVGYLASAFAIPYILFQVPVGTLADRFGFKLFLVGGYFLCAFTGALYYFSETSLLLLFGRMLQGIGEASLWALAPALLSLQFPLHKGRIIGIYNASIHLGLTGGSLLGILLLPFWRGNEAFLLFTGLSVFGGVLLLCFVEEPCRREQRQVAHLDYTHLLTFIRTREMLLILLGIMLYGAGYGIFLTIIPAFLLEVRKVGQADIGVVFTIFYIAMSFSQLIAGPMADRFERKQPMIFGMLITALGIGAFIYVRSPWFNLLLGIMSCGLGMFAVSSMAWLNEHVSSSLKGTISGTFYVFWGFGYFLGPLILGLYGQSNQYATGFLGLAGLFFLEALALGYSGKAFQHQVFKQEAADRSGLLR